MTPLSGYQSDKFRNDIGSRSEDKISVGSNGVKGRYRVFDRSWYLDITVHQKFILIPCERTIRSLPMSWRKGTMTLEEFLAYDVEGANYFDLKRMFMFWNSDPVDKGSIGYLHWEKPVRFLLISWRPIVRTRGLVWPYCNEHSREFRIAFEEYQNGTSLNIKKK